MCDQDNCGDTVATICPLGKKLRETDHPEEICTLEPLAKLHQEFSGHGIHDLSTILGAPLTQDLFAHPISYAPVEHREFRVDRDRDTLAGRSDQLPQIRKQ